MTRDPAGLLQGCVESCLGSNARWLRALGYEQVLVIRGFTHLALWFSAVVSLLFTVIWFSDVFTLRCTTGFVRDKSYYGLSGGGVKCGFEGVGILIFFAGFRDSVRMIAHFDDSQQRVRQAKQRTLDALKLESQQVLECAKANVERLRDKVVQTLRVQMSEYVREVFVIIAPDLRTLVELDEPRRAHSAPAPKRALARSGSRALWRTDGDSTGEPVVSTTEGVVQRLLWLLRANLEELDDLAAVMYLDFGLQHPEVFKRLPKQLQSSGKGLRLWDAWMQQVCPTGVPEESPSRATAVAAAFTDLEEGLSGNDEEQVVRSATQDASRMADALGKAALRPVEELLGMPDELERLKADILRACGAPAVSKKRIGVGAPPWSSRCTCSTPHFLVVFCSILACIFCIPCCCRRTCCANGKRYPKRFALGCFWVQIYTRMQERLIQGLVWCMIYSCFYILILVVIYESFQDICEGSGGGWGYMRECFTEVARKFIGLGSLFGYMTSSIVCLYYIDNLDAVMETIDTIWQLEDVQRAVRTFNHRMEEVAEQVVLLQAINERVLTRITVAMRFGRHVGNIMQHNETAHRAQLLASSKEMLTFLEAARDEFRPAVDWLALPSQERMTRVEHVREWAEELTVRNFSPLFVQAPGRSPGSSSGTSTIEMQSPQEADDTRLLSPRASSAAGTSVATMPTGTFVEP